MADFKYLTPVALATGTGRCTENHMRIWMALRSARCRTMIAKLHETDRHCAQAGLALTWM